MNYHYVLRQLGKLMLLMSACLCAALIWSAVDAIWFPQVEIPAVQAMGLAIGVALALALLLWYMARPGHDDFLGRREALLLVGVAWLLAAFVGAMPYWFWARFGAQFEESHRFQSFAACYFESMSGFSTTGASVLDDVETVPRGLLLWRAMTQWLGGLGIVVLFVAVLPNVGVAGKKLYQFETTGLTKGGVRPRITDTARILWIVYVLLTIVLALLLRFLGPPEMDWFNALAHTFTTLSTGGFSTKNAGIAAFDSVTVEILLIIFMFAAAVNFTLYYRLWRKQWSTVWCDPELRVFLLLIIGVTIIAAISLWGDNIHTTRGDTVEPTLLNAVRYSLFQIVSIITTTGFGTADFDNWHFLPQAILFVAMFVGGCAGSTAGGIKIIRIILLTKIMLAEVQRVFRPGVVQTIKIGNMVVDADLRQATLVYVIGIPILFLVGTVSLMLLELGQNLDLTTAITASAATLNNIGPGFGRVGPTENYGFFSDPSLIVMSILMALGRVEVYAIFVLFVPQFWRSE